MGTKLAENFVSKNGLISLNLSNLKLLKLIGQFKVTFHLIMAVIVKTTVQRDTKLCQKYACFRDLKLHVFSECHPQINPKIPF